jgi:probable addiction module antidote protein
LCGGDKSTQNEDIKKAKKYWAKTKRNAQMPAVNFETELLKDLRDPGYAAEYLTAALEEGEDVLLLAIRDVVQAQIGMAPLAQATGLNRENLYDMLSEEGNPRLSSLLAILQKLGIEIRFVPSRTPGNAA